MHQPRLAREREFHNARYTHETRLSQGKYYFSLIAGNYQFDQWIDDAAAGADLLEYGCGVALKAFEFVESCKSITGIDISEVAIDEARSAAAALGIQARFEAQNAEAMSFPDGAFDLVLGRGIIHHLDLARAYAEIKRVLRPGGQAIFFEPLGHNLAFNAYRRLTPQARSVDEHPLLRADFALARRMGFELDLRFYGLSTLATVPLRDTAPGHLLLSLTNTVDAALLRTPWLKWQAWYCLMRLRKP